MELSDATPVPADKGKWKSLVGPWTGLRLPRRLKAEWMATTPGEHRVHMSASLGEERYEVDSFRVWRGRLAVPISNDVLRGMSVQPMIEAAARQAVGWAELNELFQPFSEDRAQLSDLTDDARGTWTTITRKFVSQATLDEDDLKRTTPKLVLVSALYRYSSALGLPQLHVISSALDASHSAAAFWVRRAKDRGYLAPGRYWDHVPSEEAP